MAAGARDAQSPPPRAPRRSAADNRRSIGHHLVGKEPTRSFTLSAVIELVARSAIRPGTEQYAKLRGTRGAATLLKSNVTVYGETVNLRFRAKGAKEIDKDIHAPKLAAAIDVLRQLPGRRCFNTAATPVTCAR